LAHSGKGHLVLTLSLILILLTTAGPGCSHLGQAKVENFGVDAFGHKDVGRLDIAVDDASGKEVKRPHHL
jgi:hypothetical protein